MTVTFEVVADELQLASVPFDDAAFSAFVARCPRAASITAAPPLFLAVPLTSAQRTAVNERLAPVVAADTARLHAALRRIEIRESFEPLVSLPEVLGPTATYSSLPFHEACGPWAGQPRLYWARAGVTRKLVELTELLRGEARFGLHVEDCFRPREVQEGLFARRLAWVRRDNPSWSAAQILEEAKSKTAYCARLASHQAGAALDIRIRDEYGELLDIGHNYPDGGAVVRMHSPFVTQDQWQNRMVLELYAQACDLATYPEEDWHVSFGDTLGANAAGYNQALYGPVKAFDLRSGEITDSYAAHELDASYVPAASIEMGLA